MDRSSSGDKWYKARASRPATACGFSQEWSKYTRDSVRDHSGGFTLWFRESQTGMWLCGTDWLPANPRQVTINGHRQWHYDDHACVENNGRAEGTNYEWINITLRP